MSLANYRHATYELKAGDQVVASLRGLTSQDVGILIRTHLEDLDALGDLTNLGRPLTNEEWLNLGISVITQFPGLMANVIALAADEPHSAPNVMNMPMPLQLDAVQNIVRLTFTEGITVKKLVELVTALQTKVKGLKDMK